MNGVATLRQHLHLELALHLSDSQILIQSIHASQQQEFGDGTAQEQLRHAGKPAFPIGFRFGQVDSPNVARLGGASGGYVVVVAGDVGGRG